jgi:hypothetical protein
MCLLVGAPASTAAVPPGTDSPGATSQNTTPAAEAWYRPTSPTCATPVGCLPLALPAGYPEGTLHVGVAAGQEESRAYIALRLPGTGGIEGGTLQLPVGPSADGSVQPEAAKIRACLVTGTVKDKVAGDVTTPPTPDCSVTSPAVAKTTGSVTVLTVDLSPFAVDWGEEVTGALALLPAEGAAPTDTWHVAFSRHDRTGAGVTPLSATLLVPAASEAPPSEDVPSDEPSEPAGVPAVATLEPPAAPGVVPQIAPQDTTPQSPSVAGPSLRPAAAVDTSFAYPGVFLLPPLVLLAAAWVARAFTRDLTEAGS